MWVYVPSKFLASAPERGDSIEASTWRSEMLAQSCALNTKQLPPSSWLRAWRKGTWMTALFGLISTPSTAERGVAAFRASLLEYPASLIPWPEKDSEQTTNATSGLSLQASFEMFSLDGSSLRTSRESLATTLSASGPNYQRWVSALRRSSSRRRRLGRHTSANGSLYWPTAVAHDDNKTAAAHLAKKPGRTQVTSLNIVATEMWPTAQAHDERLRGNTMADGHTREHDLSNAADRWRTPDAPGQTGGPRNRQASRGMGHQETVAEQAEAADWQTPAGDSFRSRGGERVAEMGLDQQARGFWNTPRVGAHGQPGNHSGATDSLEPQATNWPTPTTPAPKDSERTAVEGAPGRKQRDLTVVIQDFPHFLRATADVAKGSLAGETAAQPATPGEPSSMSAPTSRRPSASTINGNSESASRLLRRQLNPRFVCWLMGWPPEWSSLAPLNSDSPETVLYPNRPALPSGSSNWPTPDTMNDRGGQMRTEARGAHAVSLHHAVAGWEPVRRTTHGMD